MAHQTFPKPTSRPKAKNRTVTKRRQAKRRTSEAVKRDVYAKVDRRDHYRCAVYGCYENTGLQHHHLTLRSRGGRHTTGNICLLCTRHHADIHNKRLILTGNADTGLVISWR